MASASARWPRPTTTPPTAAGAPTRRWPARSMKTLSGWCRPACATARGGQPRRRGGYGPRRNQPTPEDYSQRSLLLKLQQRVDGGHRFGVTGEYFKRTADFDNMFEQGAGTSYLYGENSVRKNRAPARVAGLQLAPSDGLLDTVTAALYWQRVSLDTRQTAVRGVDPRAFIIPRDPFRYELPQRPLWPRQQHPPDHVWRERRGDQAPGRRRDAAVDRGRRVVWQQDRAAIQRL